MSAHTIAGSSNHTWCFEGNEEVFPCPCGETHRGDYAYADHAMHTCPHPPPLAFLAGPEVHTLIDFQNKESEGVIVICVSCGLTWAVVTTWLV